MTAAVFLPAPSLLGLLLVVAGSPPRALLRASVDAAWDLTCPVPPGRWEGGLGEAPPSGPCPPSWRLHSVISLEVTKRVIPTGLFFLPVLPDVLLRPRFGCSEGQAVGRAGHVPELFPLVSSFQGDDPLRGASSEVTDRAGALVWCVSS